MHVNDLLQVASERKASDLHLKVGSHPVIRINGALVPLTDGDINRSGEVCWHSGNTFEANIRLMRRFAVGDVNCDREVDASPWPSRDAPRLAASLRENSSGSTGSRRVRSSSS